MIKDCTHRASTSTIEVLLRFYANELMYDIKNCAYIEGSLMPSDAMHNAHTVQDVGEDGNEDVVKRALHLAHCATIEMLYPFTKSEIVATEVDNRLEEKETYDITLNVPIGFSQTTITLLESLIHNWMVYRATYEWMLLTYPDKAPLWQQRMTETEIEIEKHLTMRRGRIQRHTTPF